MCNKKNVQDAINIMERAGKVDMGKWQQTHFSSPDETGPVGSESELHEYGMTACFGGWLAVSPEFKAVGGSAGDRGEPALEVPGLGRVSGHMAVSEYLGVSFSLARKLTVLTEIDLGGSFYGKLDSEVTNQDVIEKLKLILSGELK